MKPSFNETFDAKSLMGFYQDHGFCISYRQLREWIKAGLIKPQGLGQKRKVFPPSEVAWVGLAMLMRIFGKDISSIKEVRLAVDSNKPSRVREHLMKLASLLQSQRQTIQSLQDSLTASDSSARKIVLDEVTIKGDQITVAEYKNTAKTKPEELLQMEYQKRFLESKLKNKKVKCELKKFRQKRGLSQIELARILGFSQARLSQIENGWIEPNEIEKNTMAGVLKEKESLLFPN